SLKRPTCVGLSFVRVGDARCFAEAASDSTLRFAAVTRIAHARSVEAHAGGPTTDSSRGPLAPGVGAARSRTDPSPPGRAAGRRRRTGPSPRRAPVSETTAHPSLRSHPCQRNDGVPVASLSLLPTQRRGTRHLAPNFPDSERVTRRSVPKVL